MEQIINFINDNTGLIYGIIKKYIKYYDKDDLFQAGVLGLITAYRNFDSSKNTKFTSYAYFYINGEIKQYVRKNSNLSINRQLYSLLSKIDSAKSLLSQKLMREPNKGELALFLEIDEQLIDEAISVSTTMLSLDEPTSKDGKEINYYELISNGECDYTDRIALKDSLNDLKEDERRLIYMRYMQDKSQKEVAESMGIYQVEASRLERRILQKMRKYLTIDYK